MIWKIISVLWYALGFLLGAFNTWVWLFVGWQIATILGVLIVGLSFTVAAVAWKLSKTRY